LVQIYVDEIIFGATNDCLCEEFVAAIQGEFEMSMMGELSFFLRLQVKQSKDRIFLSQTSTVRRFSRSLRWKIAKRNPH